MNILKLLASDSFLTVNKQLAKIVGLDAAVMFADLASSQVYWDAKNETSGEWFYRTREVIEQQTTLSVKVQQRALKTLVDAGIVSNKLMGLPAKMYYRIGEQENTNLLNLLGQNCATGQEEIAEQDTPKRIINNNKENNNKVEIINHNKEEQKQVLLPPVENEDDIVLNPPKRKKKPTLNKVYPASFTQDVIHLLNEYIEMRKQIGKPLKSQIAFTRMCNECEKILLEYGYAVLVNSIEISIASQWQSIYPKQLHNNKAINNNNGKSTNSKRAETIAWLNESYLDPNTL